MPVLFRYTPKSGKTQKNGFISINAIKVFATQNYVNGSVSHNLVKPLRRPTARTRTPFGVKNGVFRHSAYRALYQPLTFKSRYTCTQQPCQRRPFVMPKTVFGITKGRLRHSIRRPSEVQNSIFIRPIYNIALFQKQKSALRHASKRQPISISTICIVKKNEKAKVK